MEAFKLPIIGTFFCYAKNGIEFFETQINQLFYDFDVYSNCKSNQLEIDVVKYSL